MLWRDTSEFVTQKLNFRGRAGAEVVPVMTEESSRDVRQKIRSSTNPYGTIIGMDWTEDRSLSWRTGHDSHVPRPAASAAAAGRSDPNCIIQRAPEFIR